MPTMASHPHVTASVAATATWSRAAQCSVALLLLLCTRHAQGQGNLGTWCNTWTLPRCAVILDIYGCSARMHPMLACGALTVPRVP